MSLCERVAELEDFKDAMDVGWGVLMVVTESENVVKALTNPDVWASTVFRLCESDDGFYLNSYFTCKMSLLTTGEEPGEWYHVAKDDVVKSNMLYFGPTATEDCAAMASELQRVIRRMSLSGVSFVMMASDN